MKFKVVKDKFRKNKDYFLPKRSTAQSAGYDFFAPYNFTISSKEKYCVWTDVKVELNSNQLLMIVPRSSIAIKYNLKLANVVGIIDADYYNNPDNDGNIGICLENMGDSPVTINKGDKIVQGLILTYCKIDEDNEKKIRGGGFGSTGK